jgi:hypothetical protein
VSDANGRIRLSIEVETRRIIRCPNCGKGEYMIDRTLRGPDGVERLQSTNVSWAHGRYCHACRHAFDIVEDGDGYAAVNVRPHQRGSEFWDQ